MYLHLLTNILIFTRTTDDSKKYSVDFDSLRDDWKICIATGKRILVSISCLGLFSLYIIVKDKCKLTPKGV